MNVTGSCFCKAIRYEATIDESRIAVCHCRDCQILSGSAFRLAAILAPGQFTITAGNPRQFDKRGDSGALRRMSFCGNCGTHLLASPDPAEGSGFITLRLSTTDQFHDLSPTMEVFCDAKVSWLDPLPDVVQFPRNPAAKA